MDTVILQYCDDIVIAEESFEDIESYIVLLMSLLQNISIRVEGNLEEKKEEQEQRDSVEEEFSCDPEEY